MLLLLPLRHCVRKGVRLASLSVPSCLSLTLENVELSMGHCTCTDRPCSHCDCDPTETELVMPSGS